MRKLIFTLGACALVVTTLSAQNLLKNPSFETPGVYPEGDGKNSKYDCKGGADHTAAHSITALQPDWFMEGVTVDNTGANGSDSGIEGNGQTPEPDTTADGEQGKYICFLHNNDGPMYQPLTSAIAADDKKYILKYWARIGWATDPTAQITMRSIFYTYTASHAGASKTAVNTKDSELVTIVGNGSDWVEYTHELNVTADMVGKKLAVGFQMYQDAVAGETWSAHDFFTLTVEKGPLAVKNVTTSQSFVYPTVTTNGIFSLRNVGSINKVEVFNIAGSLVLSASNTNSINLSAKAKGLYFVSVRANNMTQTQKVVLK